MNRLWRLIVVCVLALALPLQALAAVAMLHCAGMAAQPLPARVAHAGPALQADHAAHGVRVGHQGHHHADADADAHAEAHAAEADAQAPAGHGPVHGTGHGCSACAACCVGLCLPARTGTLPALHAAPVLASVLQPVMQSHIAAMPERPPRGPRA